MTTVTPVQPDLKWVDEARHTYDVDDPTFCSPESVISGLVSGFCERQAVVNSSFITGTTASPVTSDWYAATDAGKAAIVDSCVQHVICHDLKPSDVGAESYKGPVDGSFHPVDRASVQDGGVTKITTYMTHMDGLIDSMVQTGVYKTDITGATAYTTFDQLASSASAAVAGTASACDLAVSGGTNYSVNFMPMFPKDWALERKWMMEQLRYTGDQGGNYRLTGRNDGVTINMSREEAPLSSFVLTIDGGGVYVRDASLDVDGRWAWRKTSGTGAATLFSDDQFPVVGNSLYDPNSGNRYDITKVIAANGQFEQVVEDAYNDGTDTQHEDITQETGRLSIENTMKDLESCTYNPANWDITPGPGETVTPTGGTVTITTDNGGTYTVPSYYVMRTSAYDDTEALPQTTIITGEKVSGSAVKQLDIVGTNIGGKTIPVSVFFGRAYNSPFIFCSAYGSAGTVYVSTARTITTGPEGALIVLSGGTATVENCIVGSAIVEDGGRLIVGTAGYIQNCCLLTGGTVNGEFRTGTNELTIGRMFYDFIPCAYDNGFQENYVQITGTTVVYDHTSPDPVPSYIRVAENGLCVLSGVSVSTIRIDEGGSAYLLGDRNNTTEASYISVRYGGVVSVYCADDTYAGVNDIDIMSGGTAVLHKMTTNGDCYVKNCGVDSGGSLYFDSNVNLCPGAGNDQGTLNTTDGAIVQMTDTAGNVCRDPRTLLRWRGLWRHPSLCQINRFNNHSLKLANGSTVSYGWNVVDVVVPTGSTVGVFATGGTITTAGVGPVEEILVRGNVQDNNYGYVPVNLRVGFAICAVRSIKEDDVTDHYPGFKLRQNVT